MKKPHVLLDPANFWVWLLLAIATAVLGGIGTELLDKPGNTTLWTAFFVILGCIVLLGIVLSEKVQRAIKRRGRIMRIEFPAHVLPAKALIAFVSKAPGSSSALEAALHHAQGNVLEEFWMITSMEAADEAKRIGEELKKRCPSVNVHPAVYVDDIYSIAEAKAEVEHLRGKCLRKYGKSDVMCDFTGFTKSMSAGMILACAPGEARLQFMHPNKYLPDGRADVQAGAHAVEVKIGYRVEEEEEG